MAALASGVDATARHGARMLRFLGSDASTRELAKRYWTLNDQPYGWDFMFGLVGSAHRQSATDAMTAAIRGARAESEAVPGGHAPRLRDVRGDADAASCGDR
jgi:hypothetical protein